MSQEYEFLAEANIGEYITAHPELRQRIDGDNLAQIREIGDGNLNLVFHVLDNNGRSLILKQALPYVRMTGEGWPMTPDRARREAESLVAHGAVNPDLVVEVISYDNDQYILALEDLSDHRVWRGALNDGECHDGVAAELGRYVAGVAVGTSVLGQPRGEVADIAARSQNAELCVVTEDLVFTEPVFDIGRNTVLPDNEADAAALAADATFATAMSEAKWRFMTRAEALIHGDLHTGSVMVRGTGLRGETTESVKVFDSEFAFYGPVAFDLGALFANYAFAAARAQALGERERAEWALSLIEQTWQGFEETYLAGAKSWHETRLFDGAFAQRRIADTLRESALFASAKMARRIVGAAKVADIETLDSSVRAPAARSVLTAARALAAAWTEVSSVSDIRNTLSAHLLQ
ncbi:5-methylthioribose kinase [Microbacterium esteraromaticum]|uniref:S-methyl-5-thioribose kinase n=1 Tax=Microbacterium esteraromaticum TaxID=57043 RepID=A0A1R4INQ5_9MICO|nr:S-methyl-5-thioribose kinase [Microbacterium esteraromaticum]SJN21275.1 5-methylthioribose kinase [Microbacterium esteraromaticum]